MEKPWAKPFKSRKELEDALDPMGFSFHVTYFLGIIFAVLGIISDVVNNSCLGAYQLVTSLNCSFPSGHTYVSYMGGCHAFTRFESKIMLPFNIPVL